MNGQIIVLQSSSALDPKIGHAAQELGMHLDAYSLGTDTVSSDLVSQATCIILEGWDTAMVRRWAYVLEHAPYVLWIGDGYTSPPAGVGTIIRRPYTTARLVEALEPHKQVEVPTILELDGCTVDLERHQILKAGVTTSLTQQETRLLQYFARRPGEIITRNDLHVDVWDSYGEARGRAAAFAILRLRNKIERDPKKPTHIITVRGIGYRWEMGTSSAVSPTFATEHKTSDTQLRPYPTSFVGRASLLQHILHRINDGSRLLTLLGPGGTGKTRIAKEACTTIQNHRELLFVSLDASTSDESFVFQIAEAMECTLNPEHSTEDQIKFLGAQLALRGTRLLVLDNFEQVGESGALHVNTWLTALPLLQILVTSRVPLRLMIEEQCRIPTLDTKDAIQLFTERGATARRGFKVPTDEKDLVQAICSRLDNLPLAIELAAARLKILSLRDLHLQLNQTLDGLVDRRSDQHARQRTLRSTLDWSWRLLTSEEQEILSQISVFHGGFSLPAAEHILHLNRECNILDVLESLHEKSLLNVIEMDDAPDGLRFRALDMVREYGEEQLGRRGQLDAMRARHQDFYLGLTEGLAQSMFTTIEVQQRIYIERFNLLAIARHTADGNVLVRCLLVLDDVLTKQGPYGVHLDLLHRGMSMLESCSPSSQVALLRARGRANRRRAKFDEAQKDVQRAVRYAETQNIPRDHSLALCGLAALHWERVRVIQAYDCLQQAAQLQKSGEHYDLLGPTLYQLSIMNLEMKRFDSAIQLARESEMLNRQESNHTYATMAIHIQGVSYLAQSDSDTAEDLLMKSERERQTWAPTNKAFGLHTDIGLYYHIHGRFDDAREWYTRALEGAKQDKERRAAARCMAFLAVLQADMGLLMEATQSLDEAERLCHRNHDSRGLGCIEVARGNLELARAMELKETGAADKLIRRFVRKAEDRIEIPPVSGLTASCPSGIPLAEISQDVRWFTQLLSNAMHRLDPTHQETL